MGWAVVYGVQFALFVCGVPLCYYVHTATTMSFRLHSSGQLSVLTFLQNGIIWQLFLLRPADCRSNPLVGPCTVQQITFVSADLHCPCLLPSIFCNELNDSMHGLYNN